MTSYIVEYRSGDPKRCLLGGVYRSQSSRWSHKEDAQRYLENVIKIHSELDNPLQVTGIIKESDLPPEIVRHCDGAEAQVIGCVCPKCKEIIPVK